MDFQSAMETFAEAWVAANTQTPLTEAAETQVSGKAFTKLLVQSVNYLIFLTNTRIMYEIYIDHELVYFTFNDFTHKLLCPSY